MLSSMIPSFRFSSKRGTFPISDVFWRRALTSLATSPELHSKMIESDFCTKPFRGILDPEESSSIYELTLSPSNYFPFMII